MIGGGKEKRMHSINYIEIPSKDFEKSKKFYGDIFGWQFDYMKEADYLSFKTPDGLGGGFDKHYDISAKPGIIFYIEVEDIPATLSKVEKSGGKTVKGKTQISPEHGYYAFVKDVHGNQIGVWSKK